LSNKNLSGLGKGTFVVCMMLVTRFSSTTKHTNEQISVNIYNNIKRALKKEEEEEKSIIFVSNARTLRVCVCE
jgi:hypothetical protein